MPVKEKTEIDVSVIIVNWNAQRLLKRCLISLRLEANSVDLEIWVVDNASTDNSNSMVRAHFPEAKLMTNSENMGFAAANNQAAEVARGRYLLLLNPDTEVIPGTLSALIAYADAHPDVGAIGPKLLNKDHSTQRSCWRGYPGVAAALVDALYLWKLPWLPLAHLSEFTPDELRDTRDVDHLLGACMLIRRAVWNDVGPLDERYFLFLEETEWCRRAKSRGWLLVHYPHAAVVHFGQHSMRQHSSCNLPHLYRSYCRFYRESPNSTRLGLAALKIVIALAVLIRFALWHARGVCTGEQSQKDHSRHMLSGYRQVLRELPSL